MKKTLLATAIAGAAALAATSASAATVYNQDGTKLDIYGNVQLAYTYVDQLGGDPAVRAVVLTGEGRSFSAGADLDWMKRSAGYDFDDNLAEARRLAEMIRRLDALPMPTIALVQGAAIGESQGLSHTQFKEVMVAMLPAMRLMVEDLTTRLSNGKKSEPHSSIANQLEVSSAVLEVCRTQGIATDLPVAFATYFDQASNLADHDVAAMAKSFDKAR